jgi:hypothetical protein
MRRLAIVLVACLVVALAASGVAAAGGPPPGAGATKAPLYCCDDCNCCAETYGFAVMNTNGNGDLIVEVSVKKACPDTDYKVVVCQDSCVPNCSCTVLTTNGQGNGNAHVKIPANTCSCGNGLVQAAVCVKCRCGCCDDGCCLLYSYPWAYLD